MARDFDFVRRPVKKTNPTATTAAPVRVAKPTPKTRRAWQRINTNKALIAVAILLIAVLMAVVAFSLLTANNRTKTPTKTTEQTSATTEAPLTALTVVVFDRGAGTQAVDAVVQQVEDLKLTAQAGDQAQFNYDKSYVYYSEGYKTEATMLSEKISQRKLILKESPNAGIYIYLGKN